MYEPNKPLDVCVTLGILADKGGVDYVWVGDETPGYGQRDAYIILANIARSTRKIKMGPGITNPYSRSLGATLYQALTLEESAPGRTVFGLGPGGSIPLNPLSIPLWNKPIKAVRESVELARACFSGREVSMEGEFVKARRLKSYLGKVKIPIYLAARGRQMVELAGKYADGTLLSSPPKYVKYSWSIIKKAATATGRKVSSIDRGCSVTTSVHDDPAKARSVTVHSAFRRIRDTPVDVLESVGIKASEKESIVRTYRERGEKEATELITDRMIDIFTASGDAEDVIKKAREFLATGATQLIFVDPFGPEPLKAVKTITSKVIPALKAEI